MRYVNLPMSALPFSKIVLRFVLLLFLSTLAYLANGQDSSHASVELDVAPLPSSMVTKPFVLPSYPLYDLPGDSLTRDQIRKRVRLIAAVNVVGYSAAMIGLYAAWYSQYERTGFHTFDDSKEWLQMDKVGHMYS